MSRRVFVAAGAAVAASVHRGAGQTPVPPERIPLLRMAVSRLPASLDPVIGDSIEDLWLDTLCLDSPTRWNAAEHTLPSLTSYQTVPGNPEVVDLVLRPGAMFFDGAPVRAEDVQYTIERVRNGSPTAEHTWRMEHIHHTERLDPQTVRLTLSRPDASLQATLTHQVFGIMPAGVNPPSVQGGSGPFFLHVRDDEHMLYRRNPNFWQLGRPYVDTVHLEAIQDDAQRATAIATGDIDLLPAVPLLDIAMLRDEPTVYLAGGPSNRVCHLQLNLDVPELKDGRVRRLLSSAINRERLVEVATAGQAISTGLLFSDLSWAYDEVEDVAWQDPESVREQLRRLGVPSDLRLHLLTDDTDATLANTAVVLQEQLASCGIALSIDLLRGQALADAVRRRDFDLYAGYTQPWRDPHELVRPLLASDGILNHSGYASDHVDVLIRGAILHEERTFRQERYRLIERRIQQDAPVIVLFHPHYYDAVKSDIVDYSTLPPVTSRGMLTVRPTPEDDA